MQYLIPSGPMQTTAAFATLATGTAIKTLLQVSASIPFTLIEWGISFDGFAATLPGKVELIETDVAATVTASAAADITKFGNVGDAVAPATAGFTLSASGTGYNASAEGTITSVRNLHAPQLLPPTGPFIYQFPLGRGSLIQAGKFARIRVTFGTTVNAYAYMIVDI